MGEETPTTAGGRRTDALLTEWESLQDDIRVYKRQSHRRIMSGTVVMAAVAGYALETSTPWLFGFIPVIIGVMFVIHVQESNHVYYRNWKCYEIEEEFQDGGLAAFDWTNQFGALTRPNRAAPESEMLSRFPWLGQFQLSVRQAPSGVIYALGLLVYVIFAVYTLDVLPGVIADSPYGWVRAWGWELVLAGYVVLTGVLVLVGFQSWKIRREFKGKYPDSGTEG